MTQLASFPLGLDAPDHFAHRFIEKSTKKN